MRYIYDVTQLVHWPGNLTGIPRVMDELAIRFLEHAPNETIFVSWVKETGEMCEVDFKTTRTHRGNGIDYISNSQEETPTTSAPETAQPAETTLSQASSVVRRGIKKIARTTGINNTCAYEWVKKATHTIQAQSYKPYIAQRGDYFFIPWGEWWDASWLQKVRSYANEGAHIYPVCHDILPMVVPQFSGNSASLADFVTEVFPIAEAVIVPSQSTKTDLTKWMKARKLKVPSIEVVAWGEDFQSQETGSSDSVVMGKHNIEKGGYIMAVSTIEPRKNHTLLYYTYKLAVSRGIKLPKLLIIGKVGHDTSEIIKFIKEDPEINQLIRICDFVDDNELNWLYKHCAFTISASFYEGLGMSILEGIMRGKPGVCSNTSSLGEISDKYVIHFDPASSDECLDAIVKMATPKIRAEYSKNVAKYKPKVWNTTYKNLITIMEKK